MAVRLKKEAFKSIDNAFLVLQEDKASETGKKIIKDSLNEIFDVDFDIEIIPVNDNSPLFVMSVFPEKSVVSKIISAVTTNSGNIETIKKLWQQNKKWTLEIDERILNKNFINCSNRELTALVLHEIGHVVCTNSIPSRISTIIQYEIAKSKLENKILAADKLFSKILALPILNACVSDSRKSDKPLSVEIKADSFAKKMGYQQELLSVLKKITTNQKYPKGGTINKNMEEMTKFSINTLNQLKAREDNLLKKNLVSLKKECVSPYIESYIDDFYNTIFETGDKSISSIEHLTFMENRADSIVENYYTEFFFGKKKLSKIDPAELDYIDIKTNEIKNENDKMMLISYIHSKLDIIDFYLEILKDPKLAKKYNVPNSADQLERMRTRLLTSRENILKYKIPERNKGIIIAWPENYEG